MSNRRRAAKRRLKPTRLELLEALNELIEVLIGLANACASAEYWIWSETSTGEEFAESNELARALAIIARTKT